MRTRRGSLRVTEGGDPTGATLRNNKLRQCMLSSLRPSKPLPLPNLTLECYPSVTSATFIHVRACRELTCTICSRKGHTARYCRATAQQTTQTTATGASPTFYGCGRAGHIRRNCPEANKGNNNGKVFAMGHDEAVRDPVVIASTFLLNNSYACILFDSGAERSFVSHKFKHLPR